MFFMKTKSGTKDSAKQSVLAQKIPKHVGIIMDGNGRWATLRGKAREYGHKVGAKNVGRVVSHAFKSGVKTVSLYVFSSENWNRPKDEVDKLFSLLVEYYDRYIHKLIDNGVRFYISGDKENLPSDTKEVINKALDATKDCDKFNLNLMINYGGRQEIIHAVNALIDKGEKVTEEGILNNLYTAGLGDPELIIRTSGEKRLSNFMMFQSAYSELYFTDVLWPDFDENQFDKALEDYSRRDRRFGGVTNE